MPSCHHAPAPPSPQKMMSGGDWAGWGCWCWPAACSLQCDLTWSPVTRVCLATEGEQLSVECGLEKCVTTVTCCSYGHTRGWGDREADSGHCTVKHHTDIINFACMTWNFVRIPASLSALCTNFERRKEKFNPRSPVSAPGDQSFRQIWFSFYAEKKLFVCRKNIWTHLNKQQMETLTSFNL